ncbi:hypothetical protein ES705_42867 [subsurface metagenome]
MYNSSFSLKIAGQFRDCYPRAAYFFNIMYGTNVYYSASLFQFNQKKWNLFKKCVIKLDKILGSADYDASVPADITLLKQKVRHMMGLEPQNVTKLPKKGIKVLSLPFEKV